MRLSNEFVHSVMMVLQNPAVLIDISLAAFFPEVVERQNAFNAARIQTADQVTNMAAMYDFLQSEFPSAPKRENVPELGPDVLFREMLKHILAKAFNLEYHTVSKIITN